MRFSFLVVVILAVLPSSVQAYDLFASIGYGYGGTSLSDLTGKQDYDIHAGSGFQMAAGVILPVSDTVPHRFEVQFGFGYLFQDYSRNDKHRVSWSRIPLEAIYYYRNTQELFRFGYGLIYHFDNEIIAEGKNSSAETTVDPAMGWSVAIEKLFKTATDGTEWSFGFKYNFITYESSSFTKDASGDCLFLTVTGFWR